MVNWDVSLITEVYFLNYRIKVAMGSGKQERSDGKKENYSSGKERKATEKMREKKELHGKISIKYC